MLRSVYTKTLRDMRWGILGWGVGLGVLVVTTGIGWAIAYPDPTARTDLAAQLNGSLSAAQVFYGPPQHLETLGGFVEWRVLGLAPVLLGLYLILAATGTTRGAEESRTLEVVAAASSTRRSLLARQAAGLATAAVVVCVLMGGVTCLTAPLAGEPALHVPWIAGAALNVGAAALLFGAVGLVTSQLFARRRSAALAATGLMVAAHLANTLPLVVPEIDWLRRTTPSHLYTMSSPLADGHIEWLAIVALLALCGAVAGTAVLLTERRDLFDTFHRRRAADDKQAGGAATAASPTGAILLRNAFWRGLRDSRGSSLAWAVGIGLFAVFVTAATPTVRTSLLEQTNSVLAQQLEKAGVTSERGILSLFLSSFVPPLVAVFALTLGAAWAGDEVNQRLELELACPPRRWTLLAQRAGACAVALAATVAIVALATTATIEIGGLDVPASAVAESMGALAIFGAAVVGLSFALASWRPGLVVAIGGGIIAISYFADLLIELVGWPGWVRDFFIFGLYGAPLAHGVSLWRLGALSGAALVLTLVAAVRFERRDILK